jgi:hypothetical protein
MRSGADSYAYLNFPAIPEEAVGNGNWKLLPEEEKKTSRSGTAERNALTFH